MMKLCLILSFLLSGGVALAQPGDCETYGRKAVTCHERGYLAGSYDREGLGCGADVNGDSIWSAPEFRQRYMVIKTLQQDEALPDGDTISVCKVNFVSSSGEGCEFKMVLYSDLEPFAIVVNDLKCGPVVKE